MTSVRLRLAAGVVTGTALLTQVPSAPAQSSPVSAQQFYNSTLANPNLNQEPGEGWAWHASYNMGHFTRGYQAWGDTAWLDYGVRYYDYAIDRMREGPDGYKGWIGPYIYDEDHWADVHIGDAVLVNHMLEFARIVHEDPTLQPTYGAKAQQYVELARTHLFEKWDSRGTWFDDGRYGGYHAWDHYLEPGDFSQWRDGASVRNSNLGLPLNKNTAMGTAALRLYQVTGEAAYLDKAVKIFSLARSRMQHYDGAAVWNYWDPVTADDIDLGGNTTRHWVQVHPNRDYQAREVAEFVEAYHAGVVFTEEDIQRILKTNLEVMWNGDLNDPRFVNANARTVPGGLTPDNTAGTLWTALGDFSQTVRDLQDFGSDLRGRIDRAYFENVVLTDAPSFDRKGVEPDDELYLFDFPSEGSTRFLHMALTIPSAIEPGEDEMIIGVKSMLSGMLELALYDSEGEQRILRLSRASISGSAGGYGGMRFIRWDGTDAEGNPIAAGEYRIRWTLEGDGYREAPITILPEPAALALWGGGVLLALGRGRRGQNLLRG